MDKGIINSFAICGVQSSIIWEQPEENINHLTQFLSELRLNYDLIVLPETFLTGVTLRTKKFSENQFGMSETFLLEKAKKKKSFIGGGWIEKNGTEKPFNTFSIASPEGQIICRYRKIHPFTFSGESDHYSSGNEIITCTINNIRITPFICYDLRFPEIFRQTAGKTDIFIVAANWPIDRIIAWEILLQARAIENQAYCIGVNRVGKAGATLYNGLSMIASPDGSSIKAKNIEYDSIQNQALDMNWLYNFRKNFPFLNDRKLPSSITYSELP